MKPGNRIRIVVADDHQIVRTGLVTALTMGTHKDYFEVIAEASTGYEATRLCLQNKPDILIMDLHMPGKMSGFQVIRALREKQLPVKILVFTADNLFGETVPGADACILKDENNDTIINCLLRLGSTPFGDTSLPASEPNDSEIRNVEILSPRQYDVLEKAALGLSPTDIGIELNLTRGTVNVHLSQIYKKFNVRSLSQAVSFAYTNGLLKKR